MTYIVMESDKVILKSSSSKEVIDFVVDNGITTEDYIYKLKICGDEEEIFNDVNFEKGYLIYKECIKSSWESDLLTMKIGQSDLYSKFEIVCIE